MVIGLLCPNHFLFERRPVLVRKISRWLTVKHRRFSVRLMILQWKRAWSIKSTAKAVVSAVAFNYLLHISAQIHRAVSPPLILRRENLINSFYYCTRSEIWIYNAKESSAAGTQLKIWILTRCYSIVLIYNYLFYLLIWCISYKIKESVTKTLMYIL